MTNVTTQYKKFQDGMLESARKVWLAGLGAVSVVEEESSSLFEDLVRRGRTFEERGKKQMKKAKTEMESTVEEWGDRLDDRLNEALHRLGVPMRNEIQSLSRRVERLARELERVAGLEPERKVYHVLPHEEEGWKVEAEGATRATSVHATKEEALNAARDLARSQEPSQVVVHRQDGSVQTDYTYGEIAVS